MVRTFVSFEADETLFPTMGEPPGRDVAQLVSSALRDQGIEHEGPVEHENWAWILDGQIGGVQLDCIVALTDDPPIQWQAHTYAARGEARERALRSWCAAIDGGLKGHDGIRSVRWYDADTFDRDHGATWAEAPV